MHQPNPIIPAPDVVQGHTREDAKHAPPTVNCATYCHKIGHYARVCQVRLSQQTNPQAAEQQMRSPKMSTIRQVTAAEPAPTILIRISTNKRSYQTQVLPDSGADISAAGQDLLEHLDEHTDYLVPSQIISRVANGQKVHSRQNASQIPVGRQRV